MSPRKIWRDGRGKQVNLLMVCALAAFAVVAFAAEQNRRMREMLDLSTEWKNSLAGNNVTRKMLIMWVPERPETESSNGGVFTYYADFIRAIERETRDVQVCSGSVKSCWFEATKHGYQLVPIIHHEAISHSKFVPKLKSEVIKLARQLSSLIREERNIPPARRVPITVVFFVNKVYKQMEYKMDCLMAPFQNDAQLTSRVQLLATTWSPHANRFEQQYGIPFVYVPFATDVAVFHFPSTTWKDRPRQCDLFIRWDSAPEKYELRKEIEAREFPPLKKFQPGGLLEMESYLEAIRDCKMTVSTIGMPREYDLLGTRYYEVMASNTSLLVVQEPESEEAKLAYTRAGMISGTTYVGFRTIQELETKLTYYFEHESEAQAIVHEASRISFEQQRNTWDSRAKDTIAAIQKQAT